MLQTPSGEISSHRIERTFSRRCAVNSSSRTKAPNLPVVSAAFHTIRNSSSLRMRERARPAARFMPFTNGGT
jgi:hypothetical protein